MPPALTPAIIRTNLGDILAAMAQRLKDTGAVENVSQVLSVAKGRAPPDTFAAKKVVMLRPSRRRIAADYRGVGRKIRLTRWVTVYTRVASAADKGLSDAQWIGLEDRFETAVLSAFLDWFPIDSQGNSLVTEGMVQVDGGEMVKSQDDVWGDSLATYEITYLPDIDTTMVG